jgi:hypothetical protein
MLIEQRQEEVRAALELQVRCGLADIRLKHCNVIRVDDEADLATPWNLRLAHKTAVQSAKGGQLVIDVRLSIVCEDSSETKVQVFRVDCTFSLLYRLPDDYVPKKEELDAFRKGNAVFNCWPYAREFLQNMTMRLGLPVPPIPLLHMQPKVRAQKPQPADIAGAGTRVSKRSATSANRPTKRLKASQNPG